MTTRLTHLNERGEAHIVDIGGKAVTTRRAIARAVVEALPETVAAIAGGTLKKGDALAVARIAGIMAAKKTSDLIPLCHPIGLNAVEVEITAEPTRLVVTATATTDDRTGVEMEAMTAASVAALTLYDMIKAVDPAASLDGIRVLRKEGGKTGLWTRRP